MPRPSRASENEKTPRLSSAPISGERFTNDVRSSDVPRPVAHVPQLVDVFQRLRDYRRAAENMVLAESDFDAGEIGQRDLDRIAGQYERARAALLDADKTARIELA